MKKILSFILMFTLLISVFSFPVVANYSGIFVTLNGQYVYFDVQPQNINGRIMVPIRAIFEAMGANVQWNSDTMSAFCTKGDIGVMMTVNSNIMYVNSSQIVMDVSPVIIDGRTLAPARYVAEAFGGVVAWNQETSTVVITTENKVMLYAADGRTIEVFESEVSDYLNVGWYKEPYINNSSSVPYNPAPDGQYYRTPTGKKYHLDPNCGGRNSYKTTNISDLSPCSKCAQ